MKSGCEMGSHGKVEPLRISWILHSVSLPSHTELQGVRQEMHLSLLHPGKAHRSTLCGQTPSKSCSGFSVFSLASPVQGRTSLETWCSSSQCPLSSATWLAMTNGMWARSQSYVRCLRDHKSLLTTPILATTEVWVNSSQIKSQMNRENPSQDQT